MNLNDDVIVNEGIDIKEILLSLYYNWFIILSSIIFSLFCGVYIFLNTDKVYTANATFVLSNSSQSNLGSGLQSLSSLTGVNFGIDSGPAVDVKKIKGRIFIENINRMLNFKDDEYFNKYNPNSYEPNWKVNLKRIIGYQSDISDADEAIWQGIVREYSKNINLIKSKGISQSISVTHNDAHRAAEIANTVMNTIISDENEKRIEQQSRLTAYLSNLVGNALNDLEDAQSKLKNFAVQNSALPLENFAIGSLKLDLFREQLSRTNELYNATLELDNLLSKKSIYDKDYLDLRDKFPIIDQVEFRRILGLSEIIGSWSWPEKSTVSVVLKTLFDRKLRLQSEIDASQKNAERSGESLELYGKLKREAKVAEATYKVLIERVKSLSISSGFNLDNSTVYEYAVAPITHSSPKRNFYLLLSIVFGFFLGCILSLCFSTYRNVYYSRSALVTATKADYVSRTKSLLRLRKKSLHQLENIFIKKNLPIIQDLILEIYNNANKLIIISSFKSKLKSSQLALIISTYVRSDDTKIAIIDFSYSGKVPDSDDSIDTEENFLNVNKNMYVSQLVPYDNLLRSNLLIQKDFSKKLEALKKSYDLIFICVDNSDIIPMLRAVKTLKFYHIFVGRTKHTRIDIISQITEIAPIQGLLHD